MWSTGWPSEWLSGVHRAVGELAAHACCAGAGQGLWHLLVCQGHRQVRVVHVHIRSGTTYKLGSQACNSWRWRASSSNNCTRQRELCQPCNSRLSSTPNHSVRYIGLQQLCELCLKRVLVRGGCQLFCPGTSCSSFHPPQSASIYLAEVMGRQQGGTCCI
jgi:hypothetical protein